MSCSIATAFIVASFFVMMNTNAKMLKNDFVSSLNEGQKEIYMKIIQERSSIYLQGMFLGLVLGVIFLMTQKDKSVVQICGFASILFAVSYFYYILKPKSEWILPYLDTEQSKKWLEIYKTMSYRYHLGFFVGFIGFTFFAYGGVCK